MDVDKVAFTGSTEVGHLIMRAAADTNLKRVTLELGGKSPNIVFARCGHGSGHRGGALPHSSSTRAVLLRGRSRLYVEEKVYDEFVEKSVARAKKPHRRQSLRQEHGAGPQVDQDQFNKVMSYIDAGKKEKAKLVTGGNRVGDKGYFIEPTVFADVQDNMKIAQEEIFGPVMTILKFKDLDRSGGSRQQEHVWTCGGGLDQGHHQGACHCGQGARGNGVGKLLRRVRRGSAVRRLQAVGNWARTRRIWIGELHRGKDRHYKTVV